MASFLSIHLNFHQTNNHRPLKFVNISSLNLDKPQDIKWKRKTGNNNAKLEYTNKLERNSHFSYNLIHFLRLLEIMYQN